MRLIDADALWKEFCRSEAIEDRYGSGVLEIVGNIIDTAPTIDAVPVRHGRWAETVTDGFLFVSCFDCGFKTGRIDYNYCPNCGAKMGEEEING